MPGPTTVIAQSPKPQRGTWGRALAAFEGRLHWHCHFMQKLESEPRCEFENMQRATAGLRDEQCDPIRLRVWKTGNTDWPLVDACMRVCVPWHIPAGSIFGCVQC